MENSQETKLMPENFQKIIIDMANDLTATFPEYSVLWSKWTTNSVEQTPKNIIDQDMQHLFEYCITVFPERFFDILYKNEEIFQSTNTSNTLFLPGVEFKLLFNCDNLSEKTRSVMWNYLQLILFTIIGSVQDKTNFGKSMNMFDGIDEKELHEKLSETIKNMGNFFSSMADDIDVDNEKDKKKDDDEDDEDDEDDDKKEKFSFGFDKQSGIPNVEELHGHIKSLFDGKIGNLAKELAEEISNDFSGILGEDGDDIKSTQDVLKKLMKDPTKISGLIKSVNEKLNKKISSGEITHEELMKEATDLIGKMKSMGGVDKFKDIFKNLSKMGGMGGMDGMPDMPKIPKGAKIDLNSLNRMTKEQASREKMRNRIIQKKEAQATLVAILKKQREDAEQNYKPYDFSLEEIAPKNLVFKLDNSESQQTSSLEKPTTQEPINNTEKNQSSNKKKNKKKKNKK